MDARDVGAFGCLQSTIMTCPALRLLDLALVWVGDWMHGAPIIRGFRLTNGQRLPPLEHLILAGFPTALHRGIEDTWREALDLSRLKGLYLRDFREQAFNWWQETNLGSLKYFGASYPERSNNHLNFDAIPPQVESFFYRNQKIEMLGLVDFMNHMELRWLAPLSSTLHTLRIHEQSRRRRAIGANFDSRRFLTHGDILLLGKLLPNLHTLKLDIRATPNWPYGTLTSIAIAFPWLHYLEIDFDLYYETESKLLRHGYPVATMNRAASSWSHLWRILASQDTATRKRATGNVPGPDKPMDVNICRPHLKALAIIVGPPSKTLDGSRGGVSQQFHVCISKRAEEAEQGIATVTSSAVEDQLQSTPLIDSESEMAERKKTLSICRYKAEVGTIEWPISHAPTFEFEIPPHWGAKRTVQPSDIFPDKCLKFNELKTSIVGLSQETVDNLRCLAAVTPSDV
jgi:hypothetical protein